jgi:hypothetical protein
MRAYTNKNSEEIKTLAHVCTNMMLHAEIYMYVVGTSVQPVWLASHLVA